MHEIGKEDLSLHIIILRFSGSLTCMLRRNLVRERQRKPAPDLLPPNLAETLLLFPIHLRMPEILHPHPCHDNPDPSHHPRQDDQRRIISHDGQRRIIFQFWRCVWSLAYIPRPAPNAKTGTHAYDEYDPRREQQYPTPRTRFGVIPLLR